MKYSSIELTIAHSLTVTVGRLSNGDAFVAVFHGDETVWSDWGDWRKGEWKAAFGAARRAAAVAFGYRDEGFDAMRVAVQRDRA